MKPAEERDASMQSLIAASCSTGPAAFMGDAAIAGPLAGWAVAEIAPAMQYFPNGQYNITLPARASRNCNSVLSAQACSAGNGANFDGAGEPWNGR